MKSRALVAPSLAVVLFAAPAHAVLAQSMAQWRSYARGQVEQVWREMKAEYGFGYARDMVVGALEAQDDEYFEIQLVAHREYIIVGLCDDDCSDLDLLLYDAADNVVLADMEPDDEPVITVPTGYGGTFYVEAAMASCGVEPCYYAVQVFHRYPGGD